MKIAAQVKQAYRDIYATVEVQANIQGAIQSFINEAQDAVIRDQKMFRPMARFFCVPNDDEPMEEMTAYDVIFKQERMYAKNPVQLFWMVDVLTEVAQSMVGGELLPILSLMAFPAYGAEKTPAGVIVKESEMLCVKIESLEVDRRYYWFVNFEPDGVTFKMTDEADAILMKDMRMMPQLTDSDEDFWNKAWRVKLDQLE